jgi:RNA polymerase sigma-70 factor (ECF subfamily)
MNPQQELSLIRRAQNGDREALGTLWDELTPKLFGYLVNVTRDKSLAEDLLQTTWLNAINALPRFQPRGVSLSSWLFAIARNECRLHWRNTKREAENSLFPPYKLPEQNQDNHNNLLVDQALSQLSENDRELLRLRYIADLPIKDIARALNINSVTVRVRLHRAIARARTILSQNIT